MSKRKHGAVIHSDARTMIANIFNICQDEEMCNEPLEDFSKPILRAALYAGLSKSAVLKIMNDNDVGSNSESDIRNMVANIVNVCRDEELINEPLEEFNKPIFRAALYSGISKSTVYKIMREYDSKIASSSDKTSVKLTTPGKRKSRRSYVQFDDFNRAAIRQAICNFYNNLSTIPSTRNLVTTLREEINFPYSRETMRKLLYAMGFSWRKCGTKRKFLVERPENIMRRRQYIEAIQKYRVENKKIYYIGDTWVDNNCQGADGGLTKNQLILVHACSEDGFLEDAKLLYKYKADLTSGDYHGQMNSQLFLKWTRNQLLPFIEPNSVIVMDNTPYNTKLCDKVPNKYAVNSAMKEWLKEKNIPFADDMLKQELYSLIELNKPKEKHFILDEMIKQASHEVLRLPSYMCELNIIEHAWVKIKQNVREMIASSAEISLQKLQKLTDAAISTVEQTDVKGFLDHVIQLENYYWENDLILENKIDELIAPLVGNLESDDDEISSSEDEDDPDSDGDGLEVVY